MKVNGVEYGGQNNHALTFTIADGAAGQAVALTANGTAGLGSADDPVLGRLENVESDAKGAVMYHGVIVFPYTGALSEGAQFIAVDGAGAIKAHTAGTYARVVAVDATNNLAAVIL